MISNPGPGGTTIMHVLFSAPTLNSVTKLPFQVLHKPVNHNIVVL